MAIPGQGRGGGENALNPEGTAQLLMELLVELLAELLVALQRRPRQRPSAGVGRMRLGTMRMT